MGILRSQLRFMHQGLIIGGGIAGAILLTVLYTAHNKSVHTQHAADTDTQQGVASDTPVQEFHQPSRQTIGLPEQQKSASAKAQPGPSSAPALATSTPTPSLYAPQWQQYEQDQQQLRQQRVRQFTDALNGETSVQGGEHSGAVGVAGGSTPATPQPTDNDYLAAYRTGARNALEVKEGTVIPAPLIAGVNSDVAGMLKAQVRQNVYDSATGSRVLIPQGSWIIGAFSRQVGYGQTRIEVAFNRIIFPDQSSIDIGAMEGADMAGSAGFSDLVNNHWWKIMGNAVLAAAFGAAVQLSQNSNSFSGSANGSGGYNAQQIIAAQLGQQTGELGMEIARRGLQIAPTIDIRPGYEFNVMVRKDMVLPAYWDSFGNGTLHTVDDR